MVKNVRHAGIVVSDMDKGLRFYRDLLGLKKVVFDGEVEGDFQEKVTGLSGAHMRIVMLQADDGNRIELLQYLSHPREPRDMVASCDVGCSHVAFTVGDLDALCDQLTAEGLAINHAPQVDGAGYAKVVYAHDFDGSIVELVEIIDPDRTIYAD